MDVTAIVMAAGEGTRMKSNHAKVSHKILGKPMICWVVDAALAAGCDRVVVVVGSHADEVRAILGSTYTGDRAAAIECVEQAERLGTGHAVRVALEATGIAAGPVVVLNGDLPLIQAETIRSFAQTVASGDCAATVLTMTPPDPFGYGRIELGADGAVERIVEQKDCTPDQARDLLECNAGCYAFDGAQLAARIGEIGCDNAQGEYYLPDMLEILRNAGQHVSIFHCDDYREGLGVNGRAQLAQLTAIARDRINDRLMAEGVTFIDPAQAWIGPDATIGRDTVVWPQTHLIGDTHVGEDCQLGPQHAPDRHARGQRLRRRRDRGRRGRPGQRRRLRPARLPAPRHPHDGRLEGRHACGDQEVHDRHGVQGPAPLVHRRHHHGRRRERRRGLHHMQLRW